MMLAILATITGLYHDQFIIMHLIVGGDSVIGQALAKYWRRKGIVFHSSTRKKKLVSENRPFINIESGNFQNLNRTYNYDTVILCAAISKLSECEKNPDKTRIVNVVNIFKLAKQLNKSGSFIIFLSTNQVFDGKTPFRKTDDKKDPINEYGRQKNDAEELIKRLNRYGILRLTKVVYPELEIFTRWNKSLMNKESIYAHKSISLSPVDINQVVSKIDSIAKRKQTGIFHCSGHVDISYYNFAIQYAKDNKFKESLVNESLEKTSINIPLFTSLSS